MNIKLWNSFLLLVYLLISGPDLQGQGNNSENEFHPYSGQEGKDVIWVPTPQALVETMLNIANVLPEDFVIDLGSGDGRTVITAAKRGAKARGLEYNPKMVELSRKNALKEGVSDRTEFLEGDLFQADLSKATVITMFLLPEINLKLRPILLGLKPGTRVVSNTFQMEEWIPDSTIRASDICESWCDAYLWIVPAKVGGVWKSSRGIFKLAQEFQRVSGTLDTGRKVFRISDGKINGEQITFSVNGDKYVGKINGNRINGTILSGSNRSNWEAEQID